MQILTTHTSIFELPITSDGKEAVCVTTNNVIKNDGHAVMGKGIAKTTNDLYHVSKTLADHLIKNGNVPANLGIHDGFTLLSFPTKNNWRDPSDIELIKQSCERLVVMANELELKRIYFTPPGCGCGGLNWEDTVKPAIENILDDRFIVVFLKPKN